MATREQHLLDEQHDLKQRITVLEAMPPGLRQSQGIVVKELQTAR